MRTMWTAFLVCASAGAAAASPCGDKVDKLQAQYDAKPILSGAAPIGGGTGAAQTTGAMLHHQPTAASAPDAADPAMSPQSIRDSRFRDAMMQAKAAADSGDAPGCESALSTAEQAYAGK